MKRWQHILKGSLFLGLLACFGAMADRATAADSLSWEAKQNKVTAEISSWDLHKLLGKVAAATGWHIYLEPETKHTVSTKFKDRPPGEALALLLGDLSFALVPPTNGPARLYVFRTTMQGATELIRAPELERKAKPIPNELVVTLKPGGNAEALAKKLGAKIVGRVPGLNAYRFSFDSADAADAAREQLKGNSDVEAIDLNYEIQRPEPNEALSVSSAAAPPFNMKADENGNGCSPIVGLIDTPIQKTGSSMDAFLLPSLSLGGDVKASDTDPTHGTSMAERILQGMALNGKNSSGVRILPVDVYGNSATTTTFDVANGIYQAINGGAKILNLSLGSSGDSEFLHTVIKGAAAQHIPIFAAAGNEPTSDPSYPAAYPEVISVTAVNPDGTLAPYANRAPSVDAGAPGSAVIVYNGQSYLIAGTSASTAYLSGMTAGLVDCTTMTAGQAVSTAETAFPVKR